MKKLLLLGLFASLFINPVMSEDDSSKSQGPEDEPGFVDSGWDQEDKKDLEERKDYDESEDEEEVAPPPTPAANEESGQFIDSGWDEEDRKEAEQEKRDTTEVEE